MDTTKVNINKHKGEGSDSSSTKRPCRPLNEDRQLGLHLLCQDRNADITEVRRVLKSSPDEASQRDVYGRTPLFYALKRSLSNDIVLLLFDAYPQAVMGRDFCGETPLSIIYHSSKDPAILKAILHKQPSLARQRLHSFAGPDLVHLVSMPWESLSETTRDEVQLNSALSCQWEKVVLTVTAAHKCQSENKKPAGASCELHVALELPVKPEVLIWFCRMYPDQVSKKMRNGMLPIHKFLTTPEVGNHPGAVSVIPYLIESNLALEPYDGKLPLHLAIEAGYDWESGLKDIVCAGPEALRSHCSHAFLPFMYAAMTRDIDTIYTLFREAPIC